jgi:hypothetical protein
MAESYLIDKLNSVTQTFNELTRKLADPDISKDPPIGFRNCRQHVRRLEKSQ